MLKQHSKHLKKQQSEDDGKPWSAEDMIRRC